MAQGNYMQWSDLKVWKQAHTLVLEIYSITSSFPRSEIYGITNQLRRASSSVAANIVEGQARNSTKDYINFLYTPVAHWKKRATFFYYHEISTMCLQKRTIKLKPFP